VTPARTVLLTAAAMAAFASNSLLCRAALAGGAMDAVSFTAIRLLSGALFLAALVRGRVRPGSWVAAAALGAYAFPFSTAYLRLSTGTGALILFGTVQASLIGWGLLRGERPPARTWFGLALAVGGLAGLTLPGLRAPDPAGAALMGVAGLSWAVYTVRGKGVADPLAATAGNFLRSIAFAALAAAAVPAFGSGFRADARSAGLAAASGALTSGLGYVLWYAALRGLSNVQSAVVQLAVAPLAAMGGVLFLGESISSRLLLCGAAILSGIALAVLTGSYTRSR
jgi:drug/metabolite transporter (DMT)-like permease